MIAAEAIYFLPFVIARVFRPTLLDIFGINNFQLGLAFSAYGVVAMAAYFPGGPLADLLAPKKLMIAALLSTACGGIVMATLPELSTLQWLYAYWGMTTVLLFWAALIRTTRRIGGVHFSGTAFGLLDGGRGLVAAAAATSSVLIYAALLPGDVDTASFAQRSLAFQRTILFFTCGTAAAAALVWWVLPPDRSETQPNRNSAPFTVRGAAAVCQLPVVWLQATIIVCAYVGYKGLDDISLYARVALDFNEVNAAHTGTVSMWVRPVAAIVAGLLADRTRISGMTAACFLVFAIGSGIIASGWLQPSMIMVFLIVIAATSAAVHALRGLYYAIMQEGEIPFAYTGTVVGIVSTIGYTPDIFMGPLMGWLLDRSPGVLGHQHLFGVLTAFATAGFVAAAVYPRSIRPPNRSAAETA